MQPANRAASPVPAALAVDTLAGVPQVSTNCARLSAIAAAASFVRGEPISFLASAIPSAQADVCRRGPGRDEDLQGEPFVGRAGQLLTDIITKGMGLKREDVYIANVVKCRPPENRNPEPDEVAACEPFPKKADRYRPPANHRRL